MSSDNKSESSYRLTRLFYRKAAKYNTYTVVDRDTSTEQTINLRYDCLLFLIKKELPEYFREGTNYERTSDCTYVPICKALETLRELKKEGEWIRFSMRDFRDIYRIKDFQYGDIMLDLYNEGFFEDTESRQDFISEILNDIRSKGPTIAVIFFVLISFNSVIQACLK